MPKYRDMQSDSFRIFATTAVQSSNPRLLVSARHSQSYFTDMSVLPVFSEYRLFMFLSFVFHISPSRTNLVFPFSGHFGNKRASVAGSDKYLLTVSRGLFVSEDKAPSHRFPQASNLAQGSMLLTFADRYK